MWITKKSKDSVGSVDSTEDIWENIFHVEKYLSGKEGKELRNETIELIRRGNNFICYGVHSEDRLHLVPNKYVGYERNKITCHLDNRKNHRITGSQTDKRINRILGAKKADEELTELYQSYGLNLGSLPGKTRKI